MGKSITVTPEELGNVAQKLKSRSETYSEIYKQLMQEASGMGEAWKGEDNLKWHKAYLGMGSNMGDKKEYLDGAIEALNKVKTNYEERQQANIAAISKLKN